MATVTEAVKESLLGTTTPESLSTESRITFLRHANKDEAGELYMSEEDFINAIAPPEEDYVSSSLARHMSLSPRRPSTLVGQAQTSTDATTTHSTKSSANSMASSSASQIATSGGRSQ